MAKKMQSSGGVMGTNMNPSPFAMAADPFGGFTAGPAKRKKASKKKSAAKKSTKKTGKKAAKKSAKKKSKKKASKR